jgi:hypothetical protein
MFFFVHSCTGRQCFFNFLCHFSGREKSHIVGNCESNFHEIYKILHLRLRLSCFTLYALWIAILTLGCYILTLIHHYFIVIIIVISLLFIVIQRYSLYLIFMPITSVLHFLHFTAFNVSLIFLHFYVLALLSFLFTFSSPKLIQFFSFLCFQH